MKPELAQIVLSPQTVNYLLGFIVALLVWIVKKLFALDKKISLLAHTLNFSQEDDE